MAGAPLHFDLWLPAFSLESGPRLPHLYLRGWWWGPEAERADLVAGVVPAAPAPGAVVIRDDARQAALRDESSGLRAEPRLGDAVPTVLVVHALTADAVVGGEDGWWRPLVGPGLPLDPDRMRVLCFNNLGSCYGSFGPADPGFPTRRDELATHATLDLPTAPPDGKGHFELPPSHPATLTTWDQARALWLALDRLGVGAVDLVVGGSLGGMIALAFARLAPRRVRTVAPIAASATASAWLQGWNHIGRSAILADPEYPRGAGRGLEIARQLAHMTYRAEPGLQARQGGPVPGGGYALPVETYLEHQGRKLRQRFDARAYLAQLSAMDHHDVRRAPPPPEPTETWRADEPWSLDGLTSRVRAIGIDTDRLYEPGRLRALCGELSSAGRDAAYREIRSEHGHDAFLIEWSQMASALRWALDE
jgi:homoserine O-acetyltransferase